MYVLHPIWDTTMLWSSLTQRHQHISLILRTWERVEDICNRYNLSYVNVQSEIRRMRDGAVDLSLQDSGEHHV